MGAPANACVTVILLTAAMLVGGCEESRNKQRSEIRETFKAFRAAFSDQEGKQAASYLSKNTFDYYNRLLPLARNADDAQLSELPAVDLLACLSLRHRYSSDELRHLDAQKLVAQAFSDLRFPAEAPNILDIGDITIVTEGEKALATVNLAPNEWHEDLQISFLRENGQWKIDYTVMFPAIAKGLEESLADPSQSRAEMALYFLQMHENEQIDRTLLSPLR